MSNNNFGKFMNDAPKGAKKKELLKQEKRKAKAQARAYGESIRRAKLDKERGIEPQEEKGFPDKKKDFKKVDYKAKNGGKRAQATVHQRSNSDKYFKPTAAPSITASADDKQMPLNKFVAYAGICGRREAAELVKLGHITVNGDIVYEPGYKVQPTDSIHYKGKKLQMLKSLVYVLLNKPKDFITTTNDPEGRKTVLDLVKTATEERIYPVGRLDRNTTGLLLLTNDGEMAQKLTHPSFEVKKIYEARLNKPLQKEDFETILSGVNLEDGFVKADKLAYADSKDKSVIGIEIHSGKNRVVRRIFEHLGYDVKNLDRVMFAHLTKKNIERGKWRFLNEKEVRLLKQFKPASVTKGIKNIDQTAVDALLQNEKPKAVRKRTKRNQLED